MAVKQINRVRSYRWAGNGAGCAALQLLTFCYTKCCFFVTVFYCTTASGSNIIGLFYGYTIRHLLILLVKRKLPASHSSNIAWSLLFHIYDIRRKYSSFRRFNIWVGKDPLATNYNTDVKVNIQVSIHKRDLSTITLQYWNYDLVMQS